MTLITLPAGTEQIKLDQLPGLIADALYTRPAAAPVVKIFGKSVQGLSVIEPLTDADEQAIAQLLDDKNPAVLTPEIWLPVVGAISEAIGADIRWDIDNGETKEISYKRSMARLEHERKLLGAIRDGELLARTSSRVRIQLPDGVQQIPESAIVLLDDLRRYAKELGIEVEVKDAEQTAPAAKAEAAPLITNAPVTTTNKLRRNNLDPAIDKAIKLAGNKQPADVYNELKVLAMDEEKPFTGALEGDALCFTNDKNELDKLSKEALSKRLKRR